LLNTGIELLIERWGGSGRFLSFDEFSLLMKGEHEIPVERELSM
jgi:hypothetical protein